ncbi:hypothetical protein V1512DRAFT_127438 [Lipomyces arxii]|uniref:uncharacterized protein n=1 Tax=Lipomyces arxii TaxID=56418 RepID=UPI0034CF1620
MTIESAILSTYPQFSYRATTFASDTFWYSRRMAVRKHAIMGQLEMLKQTDRYIAFTLKDLPVYNQPPEFAPVPRHLFWDSDIGKWIELACYFLAEQWDEVIDAAVRELVTMIAGAQQPDGYLNIHYQMVAKGQRFTNLRDMHELYNCGHLIEAAIAHHEIYHSDEFLNVMLKYIDLIEREIGPEGIRGYPGHPEIELALFRLYNITKNQRHYDLAKFFITERGVNKGEFFTQEAINRGEKPSKGAALHPGDELLAYSQSHLPILQQKTIEGHSVRAMYLLTAVADMVRLDPDLKIKEQYYEACIRLWNNMVNRKMYVTGGIGAMKPWEGFGIDYFLPVSTEEGGCYNETCAAIGIVMFADRLLRIRPEASLADIAELSMFNALLTGMSENGDAFTYINQLGSSDKDPSKRYKWFECSCCPPNITRNLGFLGGYLWHWDTTAAGKTDIWVHQFSSATLEFQASDSTMHKLVERTSWPWTGEISFDARLTDADIYVRIPVWAGDNWEFYAGGDVIKKSAFASRGINVTDGYLLVPAAFIASVGGQFAVTIEFKPRLLFNHPLTAQDNVTVARGPIIYCVEDFDHPWVKDHFKSLGLLESATFTEHVQPDGSIFLKTEAGVLLDHEFQEWNSTTNATWLSSKFSLRSKRAQTGKQVDLTFIPYYFRDNRGGVGQMRAALKRISP